MSIVTTATTEYGRQGVHHFCWAMSSPCEVTHSTFKTLGEGVKPAEPAHVAIPVSDLQGMVEKLGTFCSQVVTQLPSKSYTVETRQNQKEGSLVEQTSCKKRGHDRCPLQALKYSFKQSSS